MSRKQGCEDRDEVVCGRVDRGHYSPRPRCDGPDQSGGARPRNGPQPGRNECAPPDRSKVLLADTTAAQPPKSERKAKRSKPAGGNSATKVHADAADGFRPGTRIETRKPTDLIASPWQAQYYDGLAEHDLKSLADSIEKNGLQQPIVILPENTAGLPPNTILDGCQRLACLTMIGETEARVLVRYDLAEADVVTIEREFLSPNKDRRQLDPLARARVAKRLWELARDPRRGRLLTPHEAGDLRDLIGKEIGMSGRNLNRYFNVLQTPVEVQDALRQRKLKLVEAERVAFLDETARAEIARRIRDGENAGAVVSELVASPERRVVPAAALDRLVQELQRAHRVLSGQADLIWIKPEAGTAVREGRRLLDELAARARRQGANQAKAIARLVKRLDSNEE